MNKEYLISFQTSAYDYLRFSDEIRFAVYQKVPAFEIFFDGWMPDALNELDLALIHQAAHNGMKFSVHAPLRDYLTKADIDEIMPVITFCRDVKAVLMTVHFDRLAPDMIPLLSSALGEVKLSIENTIPDKNVTTGERYPEYMRQNTAKYNIYATADIGHAVVNGYDPISFIGNLLKDNIPIDCFHIHNNDGQHDLHNDITSGVIDYDKVLSFIFDNEIDAHFVAEHWAGNVKSAQFFAQILQKWKNEKN
ncbi:MAG: sugar phosphate isomerase/epimerase [Spirochaetales bacterium]|nr:sugar phosphate isomerase/epimerase [Spirochaetales bacterium]